MTKVTRKMYLSFVPEMEGVTPFISKIRMESVEKDSINKYVVIYGKTDKGLNVKIELPDEIAKLILTD